MEFRSCRLCGQSKPLATFALNGQYRRTECKLCGNRKNKAKNKVMRHTPETRAKVLEQDRRSRQLPRSKEYHRQAVLLERKRNPLQAKARRLVQEAVAKGKIQRLPCEVCGNPRTEAHHDDYSKPFEIRHLCKQHHDQTHGRGT